ncbi:hypothetical protein GCM10010246_00830 [Streptomyces cuspidosporus]|uniref:DUF397 domain-containing protein n=1 Tax=Streptomyces cuspidosporus TaxID=66882 RepID=A0ABN3F9L3_9ACTN
MSGEVISGFNSTTRGCSGIGCTTVGSAGTGGMTGRFLPGKGVSRASGRQARAPDAGVRTGLSSKDLLTASAGRKSVDHATGRTLVRQLLL